MMTMDRDQLEAAGFKVDIYDFDVHWMMNGEEVYRVMREVAAGTTTPEHGLLDLASIGIREGHLLPRPESSDGG